jgi:hypothetical protein
VLRTSRELILFRIKAGFLLECCHPALRRWCSVKTRLARLVGISSELLLILPFTAFPVLANQVPSKEVAQTTKPSLAEVALQLRLQRDLRAFCSKKTDSDLCKEMTPEQMSKRILKESTPAQVYKLLKDLESFTVDDHSWVAKAGGISQGVEASNAQSQVNTPGVSNDSSQLEILNLTCEALGKAMLQSVSPELDVPFPERGDWERDLCRVRNEWHDQYLRYEGHKGTSTEIDEREKAADWWKLLKSTALVGPAKARLYLEKQGSHQK